LSTLNSEVVVVPFEDKRDEINVTEISQFVKKVGTNSGSESKDNIDNVKKKI
jgi:hypothetical protein